ncbi:MAG: glycerate kinase [Alkalibacterium sp.]|nr:glycerate kinase [Alkalibacterium sp.]
MKILAAIDSFKGSMTSEEANECVKGALPEHEVTCFLIADGGEGTVEGLRYRYERKNHDRNDHRRQWGALYGEMGLDRRGENGRNRSC